MSTDSGTPGVVRIMMPPALPRAVCSRATGQRHVLQVAYVDGAGVQRGDHGPLERAGAAGGVAGGGDRRALLQRGGVGAGQPHGELGGDLDVEDAGDPAGAEQVRLAAGLPDDAGVDDGAGLDGLERVDRTPLDDRLLPDDALVADDGALLDPGGAHDVGVLADDAAAQVAVRADVDVVVDDGPVQEGAALDDDVAAEDGVLAQLGAGLDLGVVADVERPAQHGVGVDLGALGDPDAGRDLEAVDLDVDLAVEHVGLRLQVALVGADVLPVALGDVAVDRLALLQQLREDVAGPVDGLVGVDVVEDLRLHDVDAGVDGVGEDLAPGRLLQEALDPAVLVDDGDAELQRVGHPGQADGDQRALLLVELDQVGEVEVGERVAGDDEERVVLAAPPRRS